LVDRDTGLFGDLLGAGLTPQFSLEAGLGGPNRGEGVVEVDRNPDRARLVGDGAGDGLENPPGGVSGELEALAPVELLDGADEAQAPFLDEVEEVDAGRVGITASVGDHETEVGGQEGVFGLPALALGPLELDLLLLALVVALLEPLGGFFTRFDLLGE